MNPPAGSPIAALPVLTEELPPETGQGPTPAPTPAPTTRNLLDIVLDATSAAGQVASPLDRFLEEPAPGRALGQWLGNVPCLPAPDLKRYAAQRLNRDIARLDSLLTAQVNA